MSDQKEMSNGYCVQVIYISITNLIDNVICHRAIPIAVGNYKNVNQLIIINKTRTFSIILKMWHVCLSSSHSLLRAHGIDMLNARSAYASNDLFERLKT